jgi:hypothetical protein
MGYELVAGAVALNAPPDFPFRLATTDDVSGQRLHISLFHLDPATYGKPESKADSIDNDPELLPVVNNIIQEAGRRALMGRGRGRGGRGV